MKPDWIVFIITQLDSGKKSYLATISVLSSSESGGMTGTGNSPEAQSCQSSNLKQSINQDNETYLSYQECHPQVVRVALIIAICDDGGDVDEEEEHLAQVVPVVVEEKVQHAVQSLLVGVARL